MPLVVAPALADRCLDVYPLTAWEGFEAKVAALPKWDRDTVLLRRRYVSAAVECELDKHGRILVPASLREHAGLDKDVSVGGGGHDDGAVVAGGVDGGADAFGCRARTLEIGHRGEVGPMNVVNAVPIRSPLPPRSSAPPPPHVPIMAAAIAAALVPTAGGTYVDVTLGAGGHTLALLEAGAGRVIGFDRDASALELAGEAVADAGHANKLTTVHAPFSRLLEELEGLGVDRVDGLVADLGVSSMQLDTAARGMSFRREGPLDMRMDPSVGQTALELIAASSDDELTQLLRDLGEERRARRIARCIRQAFDAGELSTTLELRRAVVRAVGPARIGGIDPATRTFQALRMAVNRELFELERLLADAATCVRPGGTIAVLTFHSLEDRMAKRALRAPHWEPRTRRPMRPDEAEIDDNPRARSAKLRVADRTAEGG